MRKSVLELVKEYNGKVAEIQKILDDTEAALSKGDSRLIKGLTDSQDDLTYEFHKFSDMLKDIIVEI